MKDTIRGFLAKNMDVSKIDDGDDLFKNGYVNSLFALQLIMFLEKEFKIKIPNDLIKEENFNTINRIEETVKGLVS